MVTIRVEIKHNMKVKVKSRGYGFNCVSLRCSQDPKTSVCVCDETVHMHLFCNWSFFPHSLEPTPSPARAQAADKPDGEFPHPLYSRRATASSANTFLLSANT